MKIIDICITLTCIICMPLLLVKLEALGGAGAIFYVLSIGTWFALIAAFGVMLKEYFEEGEK